MKSEDTINKEWAKVRDQVVAEWEKNWQEKEDSPFRVLFTRARPTMMVQFDQREYYFDFKARTKRLPADARFIEMGSGRGTTSLYLSALDGRDVTLVDMSPTALRLAKEIFASEGASAHIVMADCANTGFKDSTFDCVYNVGLLEHLEDPTLILAESMRILKPGGLLWMIIVPPMPKSHAMFFTLILRPWFPLMRFSRRLARLIRSPLTIINFRQRLSRTAKEMGTKVGGAHTVNRLEARDYVDCLEKLGMNEVQCVGFNPYWRIYRRPWAIRYVQRPFYMLIATLRRLLGGKSSMTCPVWMARCLLLLATKPEPEEKRKL